jgi:hypothetical protein
MAPAPLLHMAQWTGAGQLTLRAKRSKSSPQATRASKTWGQWLDMTKRDAARPEEPHGVVRCEPGPPWFKSRRTRPFRLSEMDDAGRSQRAISGR